MFNNEKKLTTIVGAAIATYHINSTCNINLIPCSYQRQVPLDPLIYDGLVSS